MWPYIVLLVFAAGLSINTIINEAKRKKFQTASENEFITLHEELIKKQQELGKTLIDELIPSKFDEDLKNNLLNLCQQKDNKWLQKISGLIDKLKLKDFMNKFEPLRYEYQYDAKEDSQYLGFRRIDPAPRPVRIQMVRCSEKYALIAVKDGRSGYVLKRGAANEGIQGEIFNIYAEFKPRSTKTATDANTSDQITEGNLSPDNLKQLESTESDEAAKNRDIKDTPIETESKSDTHSPTNGEITHSDKPSTSPDCAIKENEGEITHSEKPSTTPDHTVKDNGDTVKET